MEKLKRLKVGWQGHIMAFLIFAALTVIYTWPLLPHITELYPSMVILGGSNDPSFFIGYLNLVSNAVVNANPVPTETMLFYPRGVDMLGAYDGPLMFLVAVPANLIFHNPVLAYNLTLIACFLFTAMAMYFLVRYLMKDSGGPWGWGIFGGAAYAFSSYMLIRGLAHLNLMMLGVVPLLVLITLKFCKEPTAKSALMFFPVIIITALSSWYYALSGLLFVGISFLFYFRTLWRNKLPAIYAIMLLGLGSFLVALPVLTSDNKGSMPMSDEFAFNASTQAQNLFLPTPVSPLSTSWTKRIYHNFPTVLVPKEPNYYEMTSYLGVIGLLAIFAFLFRKRLGRPDSWLWFSSAIIFLILALGPYVELFHHRIFMPFFLLRRLYPFDLLRVPNRLFVLTLLSSVILAVYLLDYLRQKISTQRLKLMIGAGLCVLIYLDGSLFPYPLTNFPVPEFYRTIGRDGGNYAIAEIPIHEFAVYNYYQTVHGKPIVDGHFFYPAMMPDTYLFINLDALLYNSMCQELPESSLPQPTASALKQLKKENVKFVVVHNLLINNNQECQAAGKYIRKFFSGIKPYYADGDITVYSTDSDVPAK